MLHVHNTHLSGVRALMLISCIYWTQAITTACMAYNFARVCSIRGWNRQWSSRYNIKARGCDNHLTTHLHRHQQNTMATHQLLQRGWPQFIFLLTLLHALQTMNIRCLRRSEWRTSSSSRMRVINHNWSATKQHLHPQSVAEISRHSVLSGDRIRQCETSSGSRHKDTDQCRTGNALHSAMQFTMKLSFVIQAHIYREPMINSEFQTFGRKL